MRLRETLLARHSKAQTEKIVKWIGTDQKRFDELFRLFLHDDDRVMQRAAWPLSYAVIGHPALIKKHLGPLIRNLKKPGIHNAVKRNTIRLLQYITIPRRFQGELMNTCFAYICDPAEKPAVKAFSLTVLQNLARLYPEIKPELKTIISDRWDVETTAFRARARKVLKSLF